MSSDAVDTRTASHCCGTDSKSLPSGNLAVICNARLYQNPSNYFSSNDFNGNLSTVAGGHQTVDSLLNGKNATTGQPAGKRHSIVNALGLQQRLDTGPCSPSDLANVPVCILILHNCPLP